MRELFNGRFAPDYHPGMVLVKLAEKPPSASFTALEMAPTRAMGALSFLERAGLLRSVTRLDAEDVAPMAAGPAVAAFANESMALRALMPEPRRKPRSAAPLADTRMLEVASSQNLDTLVRELAADPSIAEVSRVPLRYLVAQSPRGAPPGIAAAPPPATELWNLKKIRWDEARRAAGFIDAQSVSVAVLDTGIDAAHPDLAGRVAHYVHTYAGVDEPSSDQDLIGHGTHVAGTIMAGINNNVGINSVCDCTLSAYKIFDDRSDYSASDRAFVYYVNPKMYLKALAACIEARVKVVNLSIGGGGAPSPAEAALFKALIDGGTAVCAAMGNERQYGSPTSYPAAIPGVIAVGATNLDDTVTTFSNRGNHIALSAPGNSIWSTLPTYPGQTSFEATFDASGQPQQGKARRRETGYDAWPGTSMATPHVSGAVALLRAKRPALSPTEIRAALMATADKVPHMAGQPFTSDYGAGRLNLEALLR